MASTDRSSPPDRSAETPRPSPPGRAALPSRPGETPRPLRPDEVPPKRVVKPERGEVAPKAASERGSTAAGSGGSASVDNITTSLMDQLDEFGPSSSADEEVAGIELADVGGYPAGAEAKAEAEGAWGVTSTADDSAVEGEQVASSGGARLIGAPPLPPSPPVPTLLKTVDAGGGLWRLVVYGFLAPKRARDQRDLINGMGTQLAKLKRQEQDIVAALGKAARVHGLTPKACGEIVKAAEYQEQRAKQEVRKASETEEEKAVQQAAYQASASKRESQLSGLEQQQASLAARLEEAQRTVEEKGTEIDRLQAREQELRRAPPGKLSDEEMEQRVREYEAVKAERKIAEMDLETAREQIRAIEKPLARVISEIVVIREEIKNAEERLSAAEGRARAAVISDERRQAKAQRTAAEYDEEVGRFILAERSRHPAFRQLVKSGEAAARRVELWDEVLGQQQLELDRFDKKRARNGFWLLIALVLGGAFTLLALGETIRRAFS